ncbi:MAG: TIR domain-containing protein [Sphingomonas sp.]|nr:TIR domain-containing protein [Sphingomonas sp.]
MADVFVSYARPDEPQAKRVVDALREQGFSVWRDDELPAHRPYADVIQERLGDSRAVVVLWSSEATRSHWVRAEADAARQAGILVQATIDGAPPPMPFNQIQSADLRDWNGSTDAIGWNMLIASITTLAETRPTGSAPATRARRKLSICVLPFENMSGDAEQEYFSDGITEDITTDLSKISALAVTARNTAFTFKGRAVDVCDIARNLGVHHVLEGSVRKAGSRVRITAQLIDGTTGDHVWAERYDRELTDIFAIQDEISKSIVDALKVRLHPEEAKAIEHRGTSSVEAYQLYLMARNYWVTGNYGDIRREERVVRICRRAIEIDPEYGRAWALLAIAQANLRYSFGKPEEGGVAEAERALSLDPGIAEAHCVLARNLFENGSMEEADKEIEVALDLDPESWEVNREAARILYRQRRMTEAARYFQRAVDIIETDYHAWGMLASAYQALGDEAGVNRAAENMVSQSERVLAQDPSNAAALGIGAGGLAILGQTERAKEWIERALLIDPENWNMRYNFACVTAVYLNDPNGALDLLEPVLKHVTISLYRNALADTDLDGLRSIPRFQAIMAAAAQRLGAEPPVATPAS